MRVLVVNTSAVVYLHHRLAHTQYAKLYVAIQRYRFETDILIMYTYNVFHQICIFVPVLVLSYPSSAGLSVLHSVLLVSLCA